MVLSISPSKTIMTAPPESLPPPKFHRPRNSRDIFRKRAAEPWYWDEGVLLPLDHLFDLSHHEQRFSNVSQNPTEPHLSGDVSH